MLMLELEALDPCLSEHPWLSSRDRAELDARIVAGICWSRIISSSESFHGSIQLNGSGSRACPSFDWMGLDMLIQNSS